MKSAVSATKKSDFLPTALNSGKVRLFPHHRKLSFRPAFNGAHPCPPPNDSEQKDKAAAFSAKPGVDTAADTAAAVLTSDYLSLLKGRQETPATVKTPTDMNLVI